MTISAFFKAIKETRLIKKIQPIAIAIGFALLIYQLWLGINEFWHEGAKLPAFYPVSIAVLLVSISYGIQIIVFSSLMNSLGAKIPLRAAFQSYFISFIPRYIPGTIWGYLSRGDWLHSKLGLDYKVANIGSVLEIMISVLACVMVIGWGAVFSYRQSGIILLSLLIALFPLLVWLIIDSVNKMETSEKFQRKILITSYLGKIHIKRIFSTTYLLLFNWCLYGIALVLIRYSVTQNWTSLSFGEVLGFSHFFAISWIIGFVAVLIPSGIGLREFTLSTLLAHNMAISIGEASLIALLFRIVMIFSEMIWVISALISSQLSRQNRKHEVLH